MTEQRYGGGKNDSGTQQGNSRLFWIQVVVILLCGLGLLWWAFKNIFPNETPVYQTSQVEMEIASASGIKNLLDQA